MPLFKVVTLKVGEEVIKYNVNINENGQFWFSMPNVIKEALSIDSKIFASNFKEAESEIWELHKKYRNLKRVSEYKIYFRLQLSKSIKSKVPTILMDDKMWKRTDGIHYIPHSDEILFGLEWYPTWIEKFGNTERKVRLKLADEDYVKHSKEWEWYTIHKPFSELMFGVGGDHWDLYGQFFEVQLTEETYNFFTAIENNLSQLLVKMFSFLASDKHLLENNISKAMQKGNLLSF